VFPVELATGALYSSQNGVVAGTAAGLEFW